MTAICPHMPYEGLRVQHLVHEGTDEMWSAVNVANIAHMGRYLIKIANHFCFESQDPLKKK